VNLDRILSILTWAGIAGLVVLNAGNATQLIDSLAKGATQYVTAVQGR
jgi:hypothetical protein